jgi:DNA-binding response OmpR family regulator
MEAPIAPTIKVLLVDDEEEFVRTMAERMELRGVAARIALNGEDALRAVADDPPDIMVLDLRMPDMDGLEVLQRVKEAQPEVAVIILTGLGCDKVETRAKRLGAFGCLTKPVDMDLLMDTIRAATRVPDERAS